MELDWPWRRTKVRIGAAIRSWKDGCVIRRGPVTPDEGSTVFSDPLAVIFEDEEHSVDELREIIVGHSVLQRLLLVSFTERGE